MTRIAVAGGTGLVGRHVVARLRRDGHDVVVLSRSTGVDTFRAAGLRAALEATTVLIDVTNVATTAKSKSVEFFERSTAYLLDAEREAGVAHHVVLSIVGIDDVDFGYYLGKRAQEAAVKAGDVAWTILRATQFHEFPAQIASRMTGPVVPVPRMRSQPVAAREVADTLVDLAMAPPARTTRTIAGPQVHEMPDLVRQVLRVDGSRRLVIPLWLPGAAGRGMASGALIDSNPDVRGRQTFPDWLAQRRRGPAGPGAEV